jgi:amino acid transporter
MPNAGYVCMLGMLTSLYGMSGYESSSQMSEETANASIAAPKGMVNGVIAAIITGFAFMLGLLYAMGGNIEGTVNGLTDQPVMNIFGIAFSDGMGTMNIAGAVSMSVLLLVNIFLGGFSHMTVTTRICYAMARDGALPGSRFMDKVHPRVKVPVNAIIVIFFLDALLCLLPLGSSTAFDAINSISTIGYQISYAIPIVLRLTVARHTFQKGPWHNGRWSECLGWFSAITLIFTSLCFFFPSQF